MKTNASWYENPKNGVGYWKQRLIYEAVSNGSPAFVDVDGDGRIDLSRIEHCYAGYKQ